MTCARMGSSRGRIESALRLQLGLLHDERYLQGFDHSRLVEKAELEAQRGYLHDHSRLLHDEFMIIPGSSSCFGLWTLECLRSNVVIHRAHKAALGGIDDRHVSNVNKDMFRMLTKPTQELYTPHGLRT